MIEVCTCRRASVGVHPVNSERESVGNSFISPISPRSSRKAAHLAEGLVVEALGSTGRDLELLEPFELRLDL
jgi:hypothetical protein